MLPHERPRLIDRLDWVTGPALIALGALLIWFVLFLLCVIGNSFREFQIGNEGLDFSTRWNFTTTITPSEGHELSYHCMNSGAVVTIPHVTKAIEEESLVFNKEGVYLINKENCIRKVSKDK